MGRSQTNPMGADPRFRQMGLAPQPPQFGQSQPPQVQAQARMANMMNNYPTAARPPQSNGMQMGAMPPPFPPPVTPTLTQQPPQFGQGLSPFDLRQAQMLNRFNGR